MRNSGTKCYSITQKYFKDDIAQDIYKYIHICSYTDNSIVLTTQKQISLIRVLNTEVEMIFTKTFIDDLYVFSNISDNKNCGILKVNFYDIKLSPLK